MKRMKTLIKNVTVLTMDKEKTEYPDGYVILDEGKIDLSNGGRF